MPQGIFQKMKTGRKTENGIIVEMGEGGQKSNWIAIITNDEKHITSKNPNIINKGGEVAKIWSST